jgi:hypothetical protein
MEHKWCIVCYAIRYSDDKRDAPTVVGPFNSVSECWEWVDLTKRLNPCYKDTDFGFSPIYLNHANMRKMPKGFVSKKPL